MPIDKSQILASIAAKETLIDRANTTPHDYQSLKTLCLQLELKREIAILKSMAQHDHFEALFKERCRLRALENKDTCLSFTAIPESMVNELYWDIAMLFQPRTMGEMLQILMPEITAAAKPHFELLRDTASLIPVSIKDVTVRVEKVTLSDSSAIDMLSESPSLRRLSDLVISDEDVLDAQDIAPLTFALHRSYHSALIGFNPALAHRLYQHNPDLRKLADRLSMLQGQGQTPLEAITQLIRELRFSGTRMTGAHFAAHEAGVAFAGFLGYLESLPAPMQTQLKALSDGTKTLQTIITHLEAGNCVEIAAANLQRIIDNPLNRILLTSRPSITSDYLMSIAKEYRKPLLTRAKDSTTSLPRHLLELILPRIEVTSAYDLVSLLLAFPPEFYSPMIAHANISADLSGELAARIKEGVLSREQKSAFFSALFSHYRKFSILTLLLFHMNAGEASADRLHFFRNLPLGTQHSVLREKNTYDETLLHIFAPDLHFLRYALSLYPEEKRLHALRQSARGDNVLHYAVKNPESITYLFSLIPEREKSSFVHQKNHAGETLLSLVLPYPDLFITIFTQLSPTVPFLLGFIPTCSARFSALIQRDREGNTILHRAVANPFLLAQIFGLFTDHQLLAIEQENNAGRSVLFSAVPYLVSFTLLFNLFPERRRLELAKDHCFLSRAASNPECLRFLLELSPEAERFNLLSRTENYNTPILNLADNPEGIMTILALVPMSDRLKLLQLSYGGDSILYRIIQKRSSCLDELQRLISKKDLLTFLEAPQQSGCSAVHYAAHNPETLEKILALYDNDALRFAAVKQKDRFGCRVLDWAARAPGTLRRILEIYPLEERFSAVTELIAGRTLISNISLNPELLQVVFALLPSARHFEAIEGGGMDYAVLRSSMGKEESLRLIFSLYPEALRFKAARQLACTAASQGTLMAFLSLLSEPERLQIVKEEKLLHSLGSHAELVPVVLALYSTSEERLTALRERNRYNYTVLYSARYSAATFQALLLAYPEGERFNALKEEVNGDIIIRHLWYEKQLMKDIIPLLSPVEKLQFVATLAQVKYAKWYNDDNFLRADPGFFSLFRHGNYGQTRAKNLVQQITSMTEEASIVEYIQGFLENTETRYSRHSFVAFLLDELEKIGSPWNELKSEGGSFNHYNKETVIDRLRSRLSVGPPSP